jgi:hypothetical protein
MYDCRVSISSPNIGAEMHQYNAVTRLRVSAVRREDSVLTVNEVRGRRVSCDSGFRSRISTHAL